MFASWHTSAVFLCLASVRVAYWVAWGGSLVLTVALIVLMWTRWGQSRPIHKCAALSLLVHLTLAFLAMTVRIVAGDGGGGGGGGAPIRVRIVQDRGITTTISSTGSDTASDVAPPQLLEPPPKKEEPSATAAEVRALVAKSELEPAVVDKPAPEQAKQIVEPHDLAHASLVAKEAPPNTPTNALKGPEPSPQAIAKAPEPITHPTTTQASPQQGRASAQAAAPRPAAPGASAYSLRSASDRLSLIEGQGGNAQTEEAVVAALNWLAKAQSRDGRWSANQFGAGQEQMVLGQDRGGAGRNADTGITALAVLAFLGAGHSHTQGEYHDTVRRGLDFLLRSQAADGSLYGESTLYAQMYCHSMSTFALAEAQAMSGDRRLEPAVLKAVQYSLNAQNTGTGGWRYRPGDSGDTSQLGWQIMALASAKRAGINIPDQTWNRVDRFLRSVRRGALGGLASYRPDSPASTSMTAEALYCHLVLGEMSGLTLAEPAIDEATNQLLGGLPTADRVNLYYWYYGTLALHHRQQSSDTAANAWRSWNDALTTALIGTQVTDGADAGSWNATCLWGGYGGRVYTTAMAAMCLEVYYRYAPGPNLHDQMMATRPYSQPAGK